MPGFPEYVKAPQPIPRRISLYNLKRLDETRAGRERALKLARAAGSEAGAPPRLVRMASEGKIAGRVPRPSGESADSGHGVSAALHPSLGRGTLLDVPLSLRITVRVYPDVFEQD